MKNIIHLCIGNKKSLDSWSLHFMADAADKLSLRGDVYFIIRFVIGNMHTFRILTIFYMAISMNNNSCMVLYDLEQYVEPCMVGWHSCY